MTKLFSHLLVSLIVGTSLCAQNDKTITYQGHLANGGVAFNGRADLRFSLWDSRTGGRLLDGPKNHPGVPVADGVFTVALAFDPDEFDGSSVYVEVEVELNGTGGYVTMNPRQALTAAPFALKTRGMIVDESNDQISLGGRFARVGIGTQTADQSLHVRNVAQRDFAAIFENLSQLPDAGGIVIKIDNGRPNTNRTNNFITFLDGRNNVAGRIEGFDVGNGDWVAPPPFPNIGLFVDIDSGRLPSMTPTLGRLPSLTSWDPGAFPSLNCTTPQWPSVNPTKAGTWPSVTAVGAKLPTLNYLETPFGIGTLTVPIPYSMFWKSGSLPTSFDVNGGNFPSFTLSGGSFPTCTLQGGKLPSATIDGGEFPKINFNPGKLPSFNGFGAIPPSQQSVTDFLCWTLEHGTEAPGAMLSSFGLTGPNSPLVALVANAHRICNDNGIVYGSKGADYAEWLPKQNASDKFQLGQVVGVRGGKVSLDTENAEQLMVVSFKPVVLGNEPDADEVDQHVKVAFMGQIPVVVRGRALAGDYIIPSGLEDGTAIVVAPQNLEIEHLDRIIGRAWSDSTHDLISLVNVVVGVEGYESAIVLTKLRKEIRGQSSKIHSLTSENDRLRQELAAVRAAQEAQDDRLGALEAALASLAPAATQVAK